MDDGWNVIPKWLYQNDLPDDELQAVYVQQAEQKWRQCVHDREGLEDEIRAAKTRLQRLTTAAEWAAARDEAGALADRLQEAWRVEAGALAFLNDAREALRKYQRPLAAPLPDALPRPAKPRRRSLSRPERG